MSGDPAAAGVVIVGAGPAGLRTAEHLRKRGFDGAITLIGDEPWTAYDRPALSKQFLVAGASPEQLLLRDEEAISALRLRLLLGRPATSLDLGRRAVVLDGAEEVPYDALVIASGAEVRRPGFAAGRSNLHFLRTLADAAALRDGMARADRLAVVGAGFVGCEVAASARTLGLEVTLIDAAPTPLAAVLGTEIGAMVQRHHEQRGVRVLCGAAVADIEGAPVATAIRLTDGVRVETDLIVVGVGASPTVGWLLDSGLPLSDGVVCDSACRAGAPGVFAVGDVARWHNPFVGGPMRVEHWTNAAEQAAVVADNVLAWLRGDGAEPREHVSVPYFWSDQFDLRLQFVGHARPGDERHEEPANGNGRLVRYTRDGRLVAALAVNAPRELLRLRAELTRDASQVPVGAGAPDG